MNPPCRGAACPARHLRALLSAAGPPAGLRHPGAASPTLVRPLSGLLRSARFFPMLRHTAAAPQSLTLTLPSQLPLLPPLAHLFGQPLPPPCHHAMLTFPALSPPLAPCRHFAHLPAAAPALSATPPFPQAFGFQSGPLIAPRRMHMASCGRVVLHTARFHLAAAQKLQPLTQQASTSPHSINEHTLGWWRPHNNGAQTPEKPTQKWQTCSPSLRRMW